MEEAQFEEKLAEELGQVLVSCEKCHLCNTVCPILGDRVTQGPYGINRSVYYSLKLNLFNEDLRNLIYSCTTCGKCVAMCKNVSRELPLIEIFEKMREFLLVEKMLGPMPDQVNVLKNMHVRGNPWGNPPHERTKWAEGLNIKFASKESDAEVLYFVGCACSYDPQGQKIARNLSGILKHAGVDFGILEKEVCSGSEALRMGETGLFQYLSDANIQSFENAGVKYIVTGDPHSFYSFSNEYPKADNEMKVQHYTQFLGDLIDEGQLKLTKNVNKKVTYHDPCYLGRRSEVFQEPRKLIHHVPGVHFVEMQKTGENSDCCGMGGGRMWMEPPQGLVSSQEIAARRIEQALDTGAEILLTACPFCNITLSDAVKSMEKEDAIQVMDITELVSMAF